MQFSTSTLLTLLPFFINHVAAQASGSGTTTRYWDCCKSSCAWPGKASLLSGPVTSCDISDSPISNANAVNGCESGGSSYMCSDQTPFAVSDDLAYGYAAVNIAGGSESSWCCACYELTFTSGPVVGKKMVVQATNTGGDLGSNQFDIAMPGGGVGIFNGCTAEWGAPSSGWGAQYGGISSNTCSSFPKALQSGCDWRFSWFQNSNNPTVDFVQVQCPAALTQKTGCKRSDDGRMKGASGGTVPAVASSSQVAVVAPSSKAAVVPSTSKAQATPSVAASFSSSQVAVEKPTSIPGLKHSSTIAAAATEVAAGYTRSHRHKHFSTSTAAEQKPTEAVSHTSSAPEAVSHASSVPVAAVSITSHVHSSTTLNVAPQQTVVVVDAPIDECEA